MTITKTKNIDLFLRTMSPYLPIEGLEPSSWLENEFNVALTDEKENLALFERQWRLPRTVTGHYFFNSRGREALSTAKEMLREVFTGPYLIETVVGLTPTDHKGALWMNKQLGFRSHGIIETEAGPHEFVLLTKTEWENMQNE